MPFAELAVCKGGHYSAIFVFAECLEAWIWLRIALPCSVHFYFLFVFVGVVPRTYLSQFLCFFFIGQPTFF